MLLEARNLTKIFKAKNVHAVRDFSFSLQEGQTAALVGESGAGKSTVAKLILRLMDADGGKIFFEGRDVARLSGRDLAGFRSKAQIIFQEPFASLDPRLRVQEILNESGGICLVETLQKVGLDESYLGRLPRQMSGGECQRVSIARALLVGPKFLVLDEPVSALDAASRVEILNLFLRLQKEKGLSYLFITHDMAAARFVADRILVMKDGAVCEEADRDALFSRPHHPYTQKLLLASGFLTDSVNPLDKAPD